AAATRRLQPHFLAAANPDVRDLRNHWRSRLALIGLVNEAVESRRPAAVDAKRRILAALSDQEDVGAVFGQCFDLVDRTESAAVSTRSAGIRPQCPLREHHRIE